MVSLNKEGWECPRCKVIVSPNEKVCPECKHQKIDEDTRVDEQLLLG